MNASKIGVFLVFLFTSFSTVKAQKDTGLIKTVFFSIQKGRGDALWSYLPSGNIQPFLIRSPVLTLDGKKRGIKVKHFLPQPLIKHANGSMEQSFLGAVTGDTTMQLAITFRWAIDNPVVRFRYSLTSRGQHHFSKPDGKDEL
jgi:hypothetical protein